MGWGGLDVYRGRRRVWMVGEIRGGLVRYCGVLCGCVGYLYLGKKYGSAS